MAYTRSGVPQLYVPSLSVPKLYVPKLNVPMLNPPGAYRKPQKPERRHVKDLGDIILGHPITGTKQLQQTLQDSNLDFLEYVPILNRIAGAALLVDERLIDPLKEGKPGVAFINSLETFGNSLDIVVNPVKSLVPWAGGGTADDFLKSMGWAEGEFREIYQYDTGNWVADIVLETLSDPLNYFSYGGKQLVKEGSDVLVDTIRRTLIKELGEEAAQEIPEVVIRQMVKEMGEEITTKYSDDVVQTIIKRIDEKKMLYQSDLLYTTAKGADLDEIKRLADYYSKFSDRVHTNQFRQAISDIRFSQGYKQYRALSRAGKIMSKSDDLLMVASLGITPMFGVGVLAMKKMVVPGFKALWNNTVLRFKKVSLEDIMKDPVRVSKQIKTIVGAKSVTFHKETFDKFAELFAKNHININQLQSVFTSFIKQMPRTNLSMEAVTQKFTHWLTRRIPELKNVELTDDVLYKIFGEVTVKDYQDLISAISDVAVITASVDETILLKYKAAAEKQMRKLFSKGAATKELMDYPVITRLKYLDEHFLKIDGRHYGLAKLKAYLKDTPAEGRSRVIALLNYFGVNVRNADQVKLLLTKAKAGNNAALKQLEQLLTTSVKGELYQATKNLEATKEIARLARSKVAKVDYTLYKDESFRNFYKSTTAKTAADLTEASTKLVPEMQKVQTEIKEVLMQYKKVTDAVTGTSEYVIDEEASADFLKRIGDLLDEIEYYPGAEHETRNTLLAFLELDFNKTDFTLSDINDYQYVISKLQQQINMWQNRFKYNNLADSEKFLEQAWIARTGSAQKEHWFLKRINEEASYRQGKTVYSWEPMLQKQSGYQTLKSTIADMYSALSTKQFQDTLDEFYDYLELSGDYFSFIVTAQGRFNIVLNSVHDAMENQDWYKSLIDPDNTMARQNLYQVITKLRGNPELYTKATALEDVITTVYTSHALNQLISTDFLPLDIPQEARDFLKGEIFNKIFANFDESYTTFMEHPEYLTKSIIEQFRTHTWGIVREHFYHTLPNPDLAELVELQAKINAGTATALETARYQQLDYNINVLHTVSEHSTIDSIDKLQEELLDTLETTLNAGIYNYCYTLSKIPTTRPVTMYRTFDYDLVKRLNELGNDFDSVLNYLVSQNATRAELLDMTDVVSSLADVDSDIPNLGDITPSEDALFTQNIQELAFSDPEAIAIIQEKLVKEKTTNLSRTIQEGFANIDQMIDELVGGTTFTKVQTKNLTKKVRNMTHLIQVDDFNRWVQANSKWQNAYAWSTANGLIGVRKEIDRKFMRDMWLDPFWFDVKGTEAHVLYAQLLESYDYVHNFTSYTDDYVEKTRAALTKLFTDSTITWGPKNPARFFKWQSTENVLAWDLTVRYGTMSRSARDSYIKIKSDLRVIDEVAHSEFNIHKRITQEIDPNAIQTRMRLKLLDNAILDPTTFDEYIQESNIVMNNAIHEFELKDLKRNIKDVDSLHKHGEELRYYIDADVEAYNNVRTLEKLETDERLVQEVLPNMTKGQRRTLRSYGIYEDTKMNEAKVLAFLKAERCEGLKNTVKHLNAKQLRSYVDHNTSGVMFFVDNKWTFAYTKAELEEAGLVIKVIDEEKGIHLIFRTDDKITNEPFEFLKYESIFPEQQQIVTDIFDKNQSYFAWEDMQLPNDMYTGDMTDVGVYQKLLEQEDVAKELEPYMNTKSVFKMDKNNNNNFYPASYSRPNMYVVGGVDAYNTLLETFSDHFIAQGYDTLPYYAYRIDKSVWIGNSQAIKRTNNKNKYLQLMFNDDFSLDAPWFRRVLDNASDAEIEKLFNNKEFQACILRQNRKGQPTVYKIYITNKASLRKAQEAGAIILPYEMYRNAVLTVNKNKCTSKLMNLYRSTITGTYKTIYLGTTGQAFRNELDSTFYKNSNTMNGLPSIWKSMRSQVRAAKMYKDYDAVYRRALELSGNNTINKFYLTKALQDLGLTAEQRKQFYLLDVFFNSMASPGPTESLQDFLINFNRVEVDDAQFAWARWYNENVLGKGPMKIIPELTDQIERTARLGLFLDLVDEGTSISSAIRKVTATHFDYKLKEPGMGFLEEIFWFSTFPLNNIMYYINEGLTKNPDMLKLQMDMVEQSWNSGPYTWDDVRNSEYLMYNAMAGHQRIYLLGNNSKDPTSRLVIKTGSSVFDFFNIIANPFGEALDRFNPFIAVLTGQEDPEQLNPIKTVTDRADKMVKGNLAPSVFTQLYEPYRYRKRHYIAKRPYEKTSRWYPAARRRRPSNQSYLRYKFTTSRFYYSRAKGKFSKNWLHTLGPVAPYYGATKPNYRYNRMMKQSNRKKKSDRT